MNPFHGSDVSSSSPSSSPSPCSTTSCSDSDSSDNNEAEYVTPKKKRYKRAINHGISKSLKYYHQFSEETCSQTDQVEKNVLEAVLEHGNRDLLTNDIHEHSGQSSQKQKNLESAITDHKSLSETSLSDEDSSIYCSSSSELDDSDFDNTTSSSDSDIPINSKNDALYEDSRHTIYSSYTMIMLFVMKHSLSREAFSDLMRLISSHLPKSATFTTSVYVIKETLKKCSGFQEPKMHNYCGDCQQYLGEGDACTNAACKAKPSRLETFYDLKLQSQLKSLFQEKDFISLIKKGSQQSGSGYISDMVNGSVYQDLQASWVRSSKADIYLTFTMNTDGVSLFSSSKQGNLWPVYIAINELPIKIRFSRKYLLPCLLHCEVEKPNMLTYLSPLMKDLQQLYETGFKVKTETANLLVKGQLIAVTTDLPARALVLNMKQFNGKYGCSICFDEGDCPPGKPLLRYYPFSDTSRERTHKSMLENATEACRTGNAVIHVPVQEAVK